MSTPDVRGLDAAVRVLRQWQYDGAPMQLHPGDLGWYWRFAAEATARAVRIWSRDGNALAVGLLDGPGLVRLSIAPGSGQDEELARRMAADVTRPERGVLPQGSVAVEARCDGVFRELLLGAYADARCLVAYDDDLGAAVATATVWSAGSGRPGLLEPVGVHRDHRGHGHGRAITVAAAAVLREMGSSSAIVCTQSANVAAVATYRSAGSDSFPTCGTCDGALDTATGRRPAARVAAACRRGSR